jgi:integrase
MSKITLWEARGEYLAHLKAQGMAPRTIASHSVILNHAVDCWGSIDVRDITQSDVDRLFRDREWATSTANLYLLALRGFIAYLRRSGHIGKDTDPTDGWTTRRTPKRSRTWLTVPELRRLLDAAWCERDRAFIACGAFLFLRGGEIAALKFGDVNLEQDEVDVYRFKGKTSDVLPLCSELRSELVDRWFPFYEAQCGPLQADWLLVPARGSIPMRGVPGEHRLIPTGEPAHLRPTMPVTKPYEVVRRAMRDIGFDEVGSGVHVLRRSGARALFERLRADGYDGALRRVSSMLGHSSTVVTEHYLGIELERRQRNALLAGRPMFADTIIEQRAA